MHGACTRNPSDRTCSASSKHAATRCSSLPHGQWRRCTGCSRGHKTSAAASSGFGSDSTIARRKKQKTKHLIHVSTHELSQKVEIVLELQLTYGWQIKNDHIIYTTRGFPVKCHGAKQKMKCTVHTVTWHGWMGKCQSVWFYNNSLTWQMEWFTYQCNILHIFPTFESAHGRCLKREGTFRNNLDCNRCFVCHISWQPVGSV